jgi:hypothetical protein
MAQWLDRHSSWDRILDRKNEKEFLNNIYIWKYESPCIRTMTVSPAYIGSLVWNVREWDFWSGVHWFIGWSEVEVDLELFLGLFLGRVRVYKKPSHSWSSSVVTYIHTTFTFGNMKKLIKIPEILGKNIFLTVNFFETLKPNVDGKCFLHTKFGFT